MKFIFIALLLLTFVVVSSPDVAAQNGRQQQKVQINTQKKFSKSKLIVKFVSLIEDARCPQDVKCIQAGNAKIEIEVSKGKEKETFEINTNLGAKGATFGGYAIDLIDLTPVPKSNIRINKNGYVATFTVTRLTR